MKGLSFSFIFLLCLSTSCFAQNNSQLPFSIISLEKVIGEEEGDSLEKLVYYLHDVDKDGRPELFLKEKVREYNKYYALVIKPNKDVELVYKRMSGNSEYFEYSDDGYLYHYEEHTGGLSQCHSNYKLKNSQVTVVSCQNIEIPFGDMAEDADINVIYDVTINGKHFSDKESDYNKYSPKGQKTSLYNVDDWHVFPASEINKLNEYRKNRPDKKEIYGDLNKDGFNDKIVIITPKNKEHMVVREDDGYVFNFNQPIMYIYFVNENYEYKLVKKYDNVIPHPEEETECVDLEVTITDRGVLKINTSTFYSMGSYDTSNHTYLYRYQNGDFYLIGEEYEEGSRNNGEYEKVSINYSTSKKQTTIGNNFDDKKPKVTWSDIPKSPLQKLGDKNLKE